VLQYAREEARLKSGGQAWYDKVIANDPVVKFLKDHRDINVHERPFPMRTNITLYAEPGVYPISSRTPTFLGDLYSDVVVPRSV
jgi:hypothetical protein